MADVRRLPGSNAGAWDWQMEGSCRGADSSTFFHPHGERGPARARREANAKAICRACPVLEQCRTHALTVREPYGIWGGLGEVERRDLIKDGGPM
jgi:WhiB family redox-sensing transcriptional regulator